MTDSERLHLESMMRVIVAMQGLNDAILFTGKTLLDQPVNAPRETAESAGHDSTTSEAPPVFANYPRAAVPTMPED